MTKKIITCGECDDAPFCPMYWERDDAPCAYEVMRQNREKRAAEEAKNLPGWYKN